MLTTFELIRFDSDVAAIYFIRSVPFRVELTDVLAIVGFALRGDPARLPGAGLAGGADGSFGGAAVRVKGPKGLHGHQGRGCVLWVL